VKEMQSCASADQPEVFYYQELNTRFHDIHVDAAGHRRLKQILQMMHKQIRRYSFNNLSSRRYLKKNYTYHREIFEAFRSGNLETAIKRSREHVLVGLKKIEHVARDGEHED